MHDPSRLFGCLAALAVVSLLMPSMASAQIPCANLSGEKKQEYQELVAKGGALAKDKKFSEAGDAFEQAKAICPYDPVLDYNLARVHHLDGDCDRAEGFYQNAITGLKSGLVQTPLTIEKVEEKRAGLDECRAALAKETSSTLRVTCMNNGVQLKIDAQPPTPCPANVELAPGAHTVVATLELHQDHNVQLVLPEGESTNIQIPLLQTEQPISIVEPDKTLLIAGWITAGTGLAMVGAGVAMHFVAEADRDSLRDASTANGVVTEFTRQEALNIEEDANNLDTGGAILMGVGGAAVAAGATLIVLHYLQDDAPDETAVSSFFVPGGGGLMLSGSF